VQQSPRFGFDGPMSNSPSTAGPDPDYEMSHDRFESELVAQFSHRLLALAFALILWLHAVAFQRVPVPPVCGEPVLFAG